MRHWISRTSPEPALPIAVSFKKILPWVGLPIVKRFAIGLITRPSISSPEFGPTYPRPTIHRNLRPLCVWGQFHTAPPSTCRARASQYPHHNLTLPALRLLRLAAAT